MNLQPETKEAYKRLQKIAYQSVAFGEMREGYLGNEPLFISLDCAIRYAKAYRTHYERPLKEDYVLGSEFLSWITGLRGLLNGQGAIALEKGWTKDSKDNGTLEFMFWSAMNLGGFTEEDL